MAADAHCLVFTLQEVLQRISSAQKLWERYSAEILIDKDLPVELQDKLAELGSF